MSSSYLAVDLGASGGRVVLGTVGDDGLELDVLHRFDNQPARAAGHERWRIDALFCGVKAGIAASRERDATPRSVGVATWGVDYGLVDRDGQLLEDPICYRDDRTLGVPERVSDIVPRGELFGRTGLQEQPFNTLYQLFAHVHDGDWPARTARLLFLSDLFHAMLAGPTAGERTIASTSQLLHAGGGDWDVALLDRLGLPSAMLGALVAPATDLGALRPALQDELGVGPLRVVAPASHDTASAVAGTPLRPGWAYISSGTWSLVGVETPAPLLDPAVLEVGLTNEAGVGGTNRLLRNVMGLWILESCRREWRARGPVLDYDALHLAMLQLPPFPGFLDPDDPRFFHPDSMVAEVQGALRETGQDVGDDPVTLSRVILESLAMRYAVVLRGIETVTGCPIRGVHIVGGGSRNAFLDQATANATGLEVLAGPVEATATGNVLVQAMADGRFADLAEARAYLAASAPLHRFVPEQRASWQQAAARFDAIRVR